MFKSYKLFRESLRTAHNGIDVASICKEYKITNWYINHHTGLVDVDGDVNLNNKQLNKLPLHFGKVSGNFNCNYNRLESLEGCPEEVGDSFYCGHNYLTSLEYAPQEVGSNFYCQNNNLISLKWCPDIVSGDFSCSQNKLTTLEGAPKSEVKSFKCYNNYLITLEGCPEIVNGRFDCSGNKLISLDGLVYAEIFKAGGVPFGPHPGDANSISNITDIGKTMIANKISFLEAVSHHIAEIPDNEIELIFRDISAQKILDLNNFKIFNTLRTYLPQKYSEVMKLRDISLSADLGELGF